MPWIDAPVEGMLAGTLTGPREAIDGRVVAFKRAGGFSWFRRSTKLTADGNGFFGAARLRPGRYKVWVDGPRGGRIEAQVEAGRVARVALPAI